MRRALRNSLAFLLLAMAPERPMLAATPSSPPASTGAARQQMQEAERARAAQLAARKEAAGRAEAAAAEERRLSEQRVAAAARLREAEAATAEAAARMDALARQREEAEQRVQARTEDLAPLLPLIERLSLYPAETMLAVPTSAEDAFRGVLVLQGIAREIEQQVAALRHEQAALEEASRAVQAEAPKLARVEAAQAALALELERQVAAAQANRREAEDDADSAARRAASLAGQADTLRAAIARIEAERRAQEERASAEAARAEQQKRTDAAAEARRRQRAFARPSGQGTLAATGAPRGDLRAPVAGPVIRSWGEATDAGPSLGLSYRAPPAAHVVSPCGGRVVFAAPFRSYGLLLILDCGGGYHFVLAGLDRLDVSVGNPVQAGEPVGVMPAWDPRVPGNRPALYVELRRDGQPVNPAPWLRAKG